MKSSLCFFGFLFERLLQSISSVNRILQDSFWDECLIMNWFMSLEDARDKIERWRRDYNEFRPHSAVTIPDTG